RTALSTTSGCTIPLPMVVATATPKPKAATKLKNAAQTTAALGVSTRVDTTVAIEFAASWKPFMKSNARATRMRAPRTSMGWEVGVRAASAVLERHTLDHVRDVLAAVDRVLKVVVDLLPLDHVDRIDALLEEAGDGAAENPGALVLEAIELRTVRDQPGTVLQVPQHPHCSHELLDRLLEQRRRLARALGMLLEEVEELPALAVWQEPGEEIPPCTGSRHTPRPHTTPPDGPSRPPRAP